VDDVADDVVALYSSFVVVAASNAVVASSDSSYEMVSYSYYSFVLSSSHS